MFRSYAAQVPHNAINQEVIRLERKGNPFAAIAHLVKGACGREGLLSGDTHHSRGGGDHSVPAA